MRSLLAVHKQEWEEDWTRYMYRDTTEWKKYLNSCLIGIELHPVN